jgi:hypothetical protein
MGSSTQYSHNTSVLQVQTLSGLRCQPLPNQLVNNCDLCSRIPPNLSVSLEHNYRRHNRNTKPRSVTLGVFLCVDGNPINLAFKLLLHHLQRRLDYLTRTAGGRPEMDYVNVSHLFLLLRDLFVSSFAPHESSESSEWFAL